MKKLAVVLALFPLAAFAAAPQPAGPGGGPEAEQMQKRMRMMRTIGLAEALDLDEASALRLRDALGKFDDRRATLMRQVHDSMQTIRGAAHGERTAAGQIDQAVQRLFDARSQLQALDREMYTAVAKDLTPEKRARAIVFFAHFRERAGRMGRMMHMREMQHGPGMMGPGGNGPGGPGGGWRGGMGPGGEMGGGPQGPMGMMEEPGDEMEDFPPLPPQ